MSKYAVLTTKTADLASDFGLEWATKLFGEEAIASLPVRQAGKNKGKPVGFVGWRKAVVAGYCREVCGPLAINQMADAWIGKGPCSTRSDALSGQWMGRVQPLAASAPAGFFFAEGRARWAAEEAKRQAEWEAEKAELMAELATQGGK